MTGKYKNLKVLITGGAGFVGSNLAHALVSAGAKVTVVDNFHPDYGANEFNFTGIEKSVEVVKGDICDRDLMKQLVKPVDMVFHIAAQCSHVDSMIDPWFDLEYNCKGTLSVLEAAKESGNNPVVVYAGTRAILGAPLEIPTKESTLPNPVDIYGVNKHAAELYGSVFARVHQIPFVSMRLTNSYGPRHQMKNGKYGILNWFIGLALQGKPIKIYGKGEQLRDYLYLDDMIDAFLRAGNFGFDMKSGKTAKQVQLSGTHVPYAVFNIGSGKGIKFVDCAKKITEKVGSPLEFIPWPKDRAAIETGDFIADGTAAKEVLGWNPTVSFDDGLDKTLEFYRPNLKHYL